MPYQVRKNGVVLAEYDGHREARRFERNLPRKKADVVEIVKFRRPSHAGEGE